MKWVWHTARNGEQRNSHKQEATNFPRKSRNYLQILGASKVPLGKIHTEDTKLWSDM